MPKEFGPEFQDGFGGSSFSGSLAELWGGERGREAGCSRAWSSVRRGGEGVTPLALGCVVCLGAWVLRCVLLLVLGRGSLGYAAMQGVDAPIRRAA